EDGIRDRTVTGVQTCALPIYLADAADFPWLHPTVRPDVQATLRSPYLHDAIAGLNHQDLAAVGRELLTGRSLPRRQLGRLLTDRSEERRVGKECRGGGVRERL